MPSFMTTQIVLILWWIDCSGSIMMELWEAQPLYLVMSCSLSSFKEVISLSTQPHKMFLRIKLENPIYVILSSLDGCGIHMYATVNDTVIPLALPSFLCVFFPSSHKFNPLAGPSVSMEMMDIGHEVQLTGSHSEGTNQLRLTVMWRGAFQSCAHLQLEWLLLSVQMIQLLKNWSCNVS